MPPIGTSEPIEATQPMASRVEPAARVSNTSMRPMFSAAAAAVPAQVIAPSTMNQ